MTLPLLCANTYLSGQKLLIEAAGTFTEKVEQGAYINLSVKYGLITLIRMKADLCDQMKEVDEECPLSGAKVIKKEVDIPKEVPPVCHWILSSLYTLSLMLSPRENIQSLPTCTPRMKKKSPVWKLLFILGEECPFDERNEPREPPKVWMLGVFRVLASALPPFASE